jgi:hypothetical protein
MYTSTFEIYEVLDIFDQYNDDVEIASLITARAWGAAVIRVLFGKPW